MSPAQLVTALLLVFIRIYASLTVFSFVRSYLGQTALITASLALAIGAGPQSVLAVASGLPVLFSWTSTIHAGVYHLLSGVAFGLPLAIAAECIVIAARFCDLSRGVLFAEQIAPHLGERVSQFELLAGIGTGLILFSSVGFEFYLRELYLSISSPFSVGNWSSLGQLFANENVTRLLRLSAQALETGLCLVAPLFALGFLFDIFVGVASRFIPKLNLAFELLPLRSILGILFVAWYSSGVTPDRGIFRAALALIPNSGPNSGFPAN